MARSNREITTTEQDEHSEERSRKCEGKQATWRGDYGFGGDQINAIGLTRLKDGKHHAQETYSMHRTYIRKAIQFWMSGRRCAALQSSSLDTNLTTSASATDRGADNKRANGFDTAFAFVHHILPRQIAVGDIIGNQAQLYSISDHADDGGVKHKTSYPREGLQAPLLLSLTKY